MIKETKILVNELTQGCPYLLRISARNRIGLGEAYVTEEPIIAGKRISEYTFFIARAF